MSKLKEYKDKIADKLEKSNVFADCKLYPIKFLEFDPTISIGKFFL